MRVLMIAGVAGKAEAGAAGVVFNIAQELRNLGHTVTPVFFEDLLFKPRWPARFRTIEFARAVAKYAAKFKNDYDIINIYAPFGFLYGFARRMRGSQAGPPYVMTMHGIEERRNYAMAQEAKKGRADYFRWRNRVWQNSYHLRTYRWSITTADQCIVTNREALLILQLGYKLPPDRVWFSANGVGDEYFHRRSFSDLPTLKLLFVGTWIDHKGIYPLADAFEQLVAVFPAAQLTIAGCAEPQETVLRYFPPATRASIRVEPFVARSAMPALYAEHDIFVLPSLVEGMPLVLLEAMASALSVVTTESSGMTDLVEHGHDGLLTIPGDAHSLADAIGSLCRDPRLRHDLGSAAQEKMKRFTWRRSALRHEAVFLRALGIKPSLVDKQTDALDAEHSPRSGKAASS
jgi:glycosyltransferase involved in cell wall biosynthesis